MGLWSNWIGAKSAPVDGLNCLPQWLRSEAREPGFVRGYEAQLAEVYRNNPVGLRSVRLVAGTIGGLPIFSDNEAAKALVTRRGLLERVAAALLLQGNAYLKLSADSRDEVGELVFLRPERVEIETDDLGYPAVYVYRGGGTAVRIAAKDALRRTQMVHIRALNPECDHYGLGCLDAAVAAASIHNRASRWNKALLDNAARPSGALSYEPADGSSLTAAQFEALRSEIAEHFSGSQNAGRPLLLDGGMKWLPMALTPADMDFISLKEAAARDIALAFGVPPALIGLPGDSTYSNAREAARALYRLTVLPMAKRILGEIGDVLGEWMGGQVKLKVDDDQITELLEDRALLWAQVNAADFLTREEKRQQLGFMPGEGVA